MVICMSDAAEAVDRQVEAYNAREIEAFTACYAEGIAIVDAAGVELGLIDSVQLLP